MEAYCGLVLIYKTAVEKVYRALFETLFNFGNMHNPFSQDLKLVISLSRENRFVFMSSWGFFFFFLSRYLGKMGREKKKMHDRLMLLYARHAENGSFSHIHGTRQ